MSGDMMDSPEVLWGRRLGVHGVDNTTSWMDRKSDQQSLVHQIRCWVGAESGPGSQNNKTEIGQDKGDGKGKKIGDEADSQMRTKPDI